MINDKCLPVPASENVKKPKDTVKKLQDHQRSHKTGICYKCAKTISCQNMPKHLKICKGVREKEMGKV